MDVFALSLRLKEEGGAAVKAAVESLGRSFKESEKNATALDDAVSELKGGLKNLATLAAAGTFFKKLIDETSAAQFAQAQLRAALQSTGNVAGQSVDELNAMAGALQETTVFADDAVTASQSLLLTFTKVQGDIFPRATKAIADVAQAMGTDLQGATIQVGKALQDPIHGIAALSRSGIQFSEDQKAMIASLVETNRLAEAQTIILKELETQFGGSAEAAGKTLGGAIARLGNAFGDLFEISESASAGVVGAIEFIIKALNVLNNALTSVRQAIQLFGLNAGVLFEEIKAFLTMSGDEYRAYMKILQQYEAEQENLILGLTKEETGTRKVAAAVKETAQAVKSQLELTMELASLRPITFAEVGRLNRAEAELVEQLKAKNLTLAEEVALQKQLKAIQDAKSKATVAGTEDELNALMRKMSTPTGAPIKATLGPAVVIPNFTDKLKGKMTKGATDWLAASAKAWQERINELAMQIKFALGDTLGNALADGIQTAIEQKSIGAGFKAMTQTLLRGLGDMMIQFGKASLVASTLMDTIFKALAKALPGGAIVASLAMIAAGAALKGAAGAAFGGGGGGGGGGGFTAPMAAVAAGAMTLPTQFYGPTAAGSSATIAAMTPMNVTIVGPNDPAAQRQMQELMRNAQRRGSV